MVEIDELELWNFQSYGDYCTKLKVGDLGQCLVAGEIIDDPPTADATAWVSQEALDDHDLNKHLAKRSNGAGKSALVNSILWILFGRTMHSANPGDKVVNYFTGKDCIGKLRLKNGDMITRTCKRKGQSELFVERDGDQLISTLSTPKNQQAQLAKIYNLDWNVFCGSAFCTQFGRPWLEIPDQHRKKIIERSLHIDRFTLYGAVAKEKSDKVIEEQRVIRATHDRISSNIRDITGDIEEAKKAEASFDGDKKQRREKALQKALDYRKRMGDLYVPDIEALKRQWTLIDQIKEKQRGLEDTKTGIELDKQNKLREVKQLQRRIANWEAKAGKECIECEQEVPHSHTSTKTEPIQDEIKAQEKQIEGCDTQLGDIANQIVRITAALTEHTTGLMTIEEAKQIQERYNELREAAQSWAKTVQSIDAETNPHAARIAKLEERLATKQEEIKKLDDELKKFDLIYKHTQYVYNAYSNRRKIKSFVVQEYRPFINRRLQHYLEAFQLDINLEMTDALSFSSSHWGYEFMSGGERKRVDVAITLTMFDLYEELYGRQSNIIVLDEVDGRLDEAGIDGLIDVIRNDLAGRVDTVLIISHRPAMLDIFPKQVIVRRKDRFSVLAAA